MTWTGPRIAMAKRTDNTPQFEAIRNFDTFSKSLRNFHDWLGDAVPGAMDVDFFVERKGQFLVVELKPWTRGVVLSYGQHLALYRLSCAPGFRVYIAGEDGEDVHVALVNDAPKPEFTRSRGRVEAWWRPERFMPVGREGLKHIVKSWWADAGEAGDVQ
jgi:hypothetical protein